MGRFSNKVVLVTGAASGIGAEAARRFGQEGAKLVLADKNGDGLRDVAAGTAAETVVHVADLSDVEQCKGLIEAAVARFGGLDVLVNNAGKDHLGKVDEGDIADFTTIIETDLYGVFYMTRFALPHLRRSRGCIVNVSSVSGLGGDWNHSFYCAAKGAVTNFTRAIAMDEAANGVRVNAVNPSLVYTPFTAGMQEQPELVAKFNERIPMGRGARPDDISGVIAFLASEDAHFVTGVNLPVDGGLSASNGQPIGNGTTSGRAKRASAAARRASSGMEKAAAPEAERCLRRAPVDRDRHEPESRKDETSKGHAHEPLAFPA